MASPVAVLLGSLDDGEADMRAVGLVEVLVVELVEPDKGRDDCCVVDCGSVALVVTGADVLATVPFSQG